MKHLIFLLLVSCAAASAQRVELGVTAGYGAYGTDIFNFGDSYTIGAEACFVCAGHVSGFLTFEHWGAAGSVAGQFTRSELVAGGLRLQGGNRVRPFFDIGVAGGGDEYKVWSGERRTHGLKGVVFGGGAAIGIGERWYIRPQVRAYVLSGITAAVGASVGFGYRF